MAIARILFVVLSLLMSQVSHADAPPPPSIDELRAHIDQIDDGLLLLLNERMAYSKQIGALKRLTGTKVHDPAREKQILERLITSPHEHLSDRQISDIWITLMLISKQAQ